MFWRHRQLESSWCTQSETKSFFTSGHISRRIFMPSHYSGRLRISIGFQINLDESCMKQNAILLLLTIPGCWYHTPLSWRIPNPRLDLSLSHNSSFRTFNTAISVNSLLFGMLPLPVLLITRMTLRFKTGHPQPQFFTSWEGSPWPTRSLSPQHVALDYPWSRWDVLVVKKPSSKWLASDM